jgi:hypothetical protein
VKNGNCNRGRFQPGNPGNPNARGRPRRSVEQSYLDATVGSVSIADWKVVCRTALEQAKGGDAKAREWLGKLLVGTEVIPEVLDPAGQQAGLDNHDAGLFLVEQSAELASRGVEGREADFASGRVGGAAHGLVFPEVNGQNGRVRRRGAVHGASSSWG